MKLCERYSNLRFSGILRSVDWQLVTNVLGQTIGPLFKGEAVQEGPETSVTTNLRCITSQKTEDLVYTNIAEA